MKIFLTGLIFLSAVAPRAGAVGQIPTARDRGHVSMRSAHQAESSTRRAGVPEFFHQAKTEVNNQS
jgi:hypothetical protein